MRGLVAQHLYSETAYRSIAEDLRQRVGITTRRGQSAQTVVRIVLVGDYECEPRASHRPSLQRMRPDPVRR
jgi:hypothetical protein